MGLKEPFLRFKSFDGEPFIYEHRTGRIFHINKQRHLQIGIGEKTQFKIDRNRVKKGLEEELELLILNVSDACNLRCKYCIFSGNYYGEHSYEENPISLGIARKSIDYLFEHSAQIERRVLSLYGGEPLLKQNKELVYAITEYASEESNRREMPIEFALTTNGMQLEGWSEWLIKNNVLTFVSLDGPEEVQNKYRGKGTFKKIMEGLNKIKRLNTNYFTDRISFSSTFVDVRDLHSIRTFFNSNFPENRIRIAGVNLLGINKDAPLINLIGRDDAKEIYTEFAKEFAERISKGEEPDNFLRGAFDQTMMLIYFRNRTIFEKPMWPTNMCVPGGKKLFVRDNGKFYPCEKIYGRDFEIGSVDEGVNTEKVIALLEVYNNSCNSTCYDCWAPRLCSSCLISVREGGRLKPTIKQNSCQPILENLKIGLQLYTTTIRRNKENIEKYLKSLTSN